MMNRAAISTLPRKPHEEQSAAAAFGRTLVIGLIAFLTLVDLFATQAILPSLVAHYQVTPAAMGFAVNASTFGMAIAALVMAFLGRRIDRRRGVVSQPRAARAADRAACRRARPDDLHRAAHRAGTGDVERIRADLVVPGRALQQGRGRRRVCRLRHRQCRQQPVRPPAVGRARRFARAGRQLSRLRGVEPGRRTARVVRAGALDADAVRRLRHRRRWRSWPTTCATARCAPAS